MIVVTLLLLAIFARIFKTNQPPMSKGPPLISNSDILRTLTDGSDLELKKIVGDPRLRISVIQLQHLGLTRVEEEEEE